MGNKPFGTPDELEVGSTHAVRMKLNVTNGNILFIFILL
jgi:hypothetical protein